MSDLRSTVDELAKVEAELTRRRRENGLAYYGPWEKQKLFHEAGATYRERLFLAGNQLGKTFSGASEVAMHLTGRYPDWWTGKRFDRPIRCWVAGDTTETTRDNPQRLLFGVAPEYGTGAIPKDALAGDPKMNRGMADAIDTGVIRHKSGGYSTIKFKNYEQGRAKWQGETLDLIWMDEEPPQEIYSEGLTRLKPPGILILTATPLKGMTEVVAMYYPEPTTPNRAFIQMTIEDAGHYTPEERALKVAGYLPHEREARSKGIPLLGSGRVFPVPEEVIRWEPDTLPKHFPRICGLDFGWDHPTAAVWLAWDREANTTYLYDCYRVREQAVLVHAAALKARGAWIPVAWPHDGQHRKAGNPEPLRDQYRVHGVKMLEDYAQYVVGGYGIEPGVQDILDRMQMGRFKVASHLTDWWTEFRNYHRKDGMIVDKADDLMSATRYAIMMLRCAATEPVAEAGDRYRRGRFKVVGGSSWMAA